MKITLAEPRFFKDSISIISELVTEASFKINKDGLEMVAMDPANVAMVMFKLLASNFSEFEVENETIAINLNNLKQILRRVKSNDTLTLETQENKLKVQLKGSTVRTFKIPIIDLEEREQRVPDLEFAASVKMNSSLMNDLIEDAEIVAESVAFIAEPERLQVVAEGDLSNVKVEVDKEVSIKCSGKVKSKYSIEYMKKMISGSKLSNEVVMNFGNNYPLKLDYEVVDKLILSFILAPRVDND